MSNYRTIENILTDSGINAKFKKHSEEDWSEVVNRAEYVSIEYTSYQEAYQYEYFKSISKSTINISLVIYHDAKASAIWPLMLDVDSCEPVKTKNNQYGGIVVPPLFIKGFPKKSQRKINKSCISFLNNVVEKYSGNCWKSNEISINNAGLGQWYQTILEGGAEFYKVNNEMYVDLSLSTNDYRKYIRKSYRPLISSGYKSWETFIMDGSNKNELIWKNFKNLHKKVSGKVTRSDATWSIQYNAISANNAFLVYIVDSNKKMVGGGLFDISADECNYGVGAYNRDLIDQPLGHMIQYHAIQEMKKRKIQWYRLGSRFYKEESMHVDKKRVSISNFTQGFMTHMFPRIELLVR